MMAKRNQYQNMRKMIGFSEASWATAIENELVDLSVSLAEAPFAVHGDRKIVNLCSCSYLGLDTHEAVLDGAVAGIRRAGLLHLTTARCRITLGLLDETEDELGLQFGADAIVYNSCAAATAAALPVLASGVLTDDVKPLMAFDRFAHFSINQLKPLCADETEVVTCPHNDLNFLEDLCKKHDRVAYVSDGTSSIRGFAPVEELLQLHHRYGLFLYFDDSHGLSITGARGEGHVLERLRDLDEGMVVVASLAKAFGAAGGVLLSGHPRMKYYLVKYGNPWSQYLNSAGLGGILGSLAVHRSAELGQRQARWRANLELFDSRVDALGRASLSPIRVILLRSPRDAVLAAKQILLAGFYTSAVFFPVVPRETAGLRIMPRADVPSELLQQFCDVVSEATEGRRLDSSILG